MVHFVFNIFILTAIYVFKDVGYAGARSCNNATEFPCLNGGCVLRSSWCDSEIDCDDETDESYCFGGQCPLNYFRCDNGICIPESGRCDRIMTCVDNSDERGCAYKGVCKNHELPCETRGCVDRKEWCNHREDCEDGSDEAYCYSFGECPPYYFRCFSGECIPPEGRCDGIWTCTDASDERNCIFSTTTTIAPPSSSIQYLSDRSLNSNIPEAAAKAVRWILSQRGASGWGKHTTRAVIALYLADISFFEYNTQDSNIIEKQLQLELVTELYRNNTKKPMPLSTLSLYINALSATCHDPRNFHGTNLVDVLRYRTNLTQHSAFVSPIVFLTLCIEGQATGDDLRRMDDQFVRKGISSHYGLQALGVIAASCMQQQRGIDGRRLREDMYRKLERNVVSFRFGSIHTAALVFQAVRLVGRNKTLESELEKYVLAHQNDNGSFGDMLATYYSLPAITGYGLEALIRPCYNVSGLIPLEILKNFAGGKIHVTFTTYVGDGKSINHSVGIAAPPNTSFFDIVRLAEDKNPAFRFKYHGTDAIKVYFIGSLTNDAERGIAWVPYVEKLGQKIDRDSPRLSQNIADFIPDDGDHLIYWYRTIL